MEDDSSKRGVVIKGPWKKVVEQKIDKDITKLSSNRTSIGIETESLEKPLIED